MNKDNILASLVIAAGLVVAVVFGSKSPEITVNTPAIPAPQVNVQAPEQPVGATPGLEFLNGIYATKYNGIASVNASTTSSTAPTLPLNLRSGSTGTITVGTSTPAVRTTYASTTAITANSMVRFQQTTNGPAGVTCNTTGATSTIYTIYSSSTNPSLNGFSVTLGSIPATNPVCLDYYIFDKSTTGY